MRLLPLALHATSYVGGPNARTVTVTSTIEMLGAPSILGAKTGSHVGRKIYNLVVAWRPPNGQTMLPWCSGPQTMPHATTTSGQFWRCRTIFGIGRAGLLDRRTAAPADSFNLCRHDLARKDAVRSGAR
jgi:hypothetical protein